MSRLNKSIKTSIIEKAIADKFKVQYEKAFRKVTVASRNFVVKNSSHNEFKALNLPFEMLRHISSDNYFSLDDNIESHVDFISKKWNIKFDDPVYGVSGINYLRDEDVKELADLRKLIKTIEIEHSELTCVVNSYNNVKKLLADLPWVEKYLPLISSDCTGLIAADVIADINAKFGK